MSIDINHSERRQFKRYRVNLKAILAFEDSLTLKCTILDFCTRGLFLEIKQPTTDLSRLLHKRGKVVFSVTSDQDREYMQVDAEVMRVCPNGLGVAYEKMYDSVFQALIQIANRQAQPESSGDQIPPFASVNLQRLKIAFEVMLNDKLPVLMSRFFSRVFDALEQAKAEDGSYSEQTASIDAEYVRKNLRLFQDAIVNDFCQSVLQETEFVRKLNIASTAAVYDGHTLSLIDKDDFEIWLNLTSSIRKVESDFKAQLYQFDLKLSYVTGIPRRNINNPISPARLYESFNKSISPIEEIKTIRQMLYKVFEDALRENLYLLYQPLEKILGDYGAPEQIIEGIVPQADKTPKAKRGMSSEENPYHNVHQAGLLRLAQHGLSPSDMIGLPFQQTLRPRQGQPIAQTASRLLDIINQSNSSAWQSAPGDLTATEKPASDESNYSSAYSSDEIVKAIALLQAKEAANNVMHQDSVTLQKHLADTLSGVTQGSKQFSSTDKNRLEVYGQLFDTLTNDLMFTPHVKLYLESIHLPLMALALKDSQFLDSGNHPALSVLNKLSALESVVKGNRIIKRQKVRQTLDQLFARIAQESMTNPEIFAIANEELKDITVSVAKSAELNIRRVIEAYEGKQKLEKARQVIQQEIDDRIAGKRIPKVIATLLDSGWQHLLVITELNDDNQLNSRQRYLKILDRLQDWLACEEAFSGEQKSEIERELALIENHLGSVCTNAFLHDKVMDELKAALLGSGEPRIRRPVESIQIGQRVEETKHPGDVIDNNWTRQVSRLQIGDWLTLMLEAEEFEPLKLVWISSQSDVYVFVNREGQKKLELSRDELAALMRSGAVNKIESLDIPLMDRAANMMLQKMHEKMVYNASHDPISLLINRREFINQLKAEITLLDNTSHMLCYLDIPDFRMITNICGLIAGDELIKNISQLIQSHLGQHDILARLGDNTFGILMKDCSGDEAHETAKTLSRNIKNSHFEWGGKSYSVGSSIGLVAFVNQGASIEELLHQADSASIMAKNKGHSRVCLYKDDDAAIKLHTIINDWVGRIDQVFSENRLFARCQQIAPIDPDKTPHSHYELLLGVKDETGNIIAPDNFLPAVEHCRRMPEIDQWMINTAFTWIEQHRPYFDGIGGFAINLSGQSLNSEEFLEHLLLRLAACDFPLHKITFEVTETVASDNLIFTEKFISEIKRFGCKFSLDDFGTGYSSYSYLKNLDVDYLKIDGSFVKEIVNSPADVAMVKSMNEIAHSLGLQSIAEYVESKEIHAILKEIGVDYAQGWIIHKPVSLTEIGH